MLSALSEWLSGASGLEPHGFCLLWEPGLIWLYAVSDTMIALAYFSIPLTLVVVGRQRGDLVLRPMLWLFAAFILLCGATHWLDVITLWAPLYRLQGLVKAATAVASIFTAMALWWGLPGFLALPSVDALRRANAALRASQEQLAHAQKMEALGQLTGGIAHDFNNLLQVITASHNSIERLIAQGEGQDIKPALAAIAKASRTASSLINRMLAFSLRQTLLPRQLDPNQLVAGLEELLRRTLGPEIDLELRLGKGVRGVICDPSQLESALLNLSINARDAMPQGGALSITTANRAFSTDELEPGLDAGDYVEIEVRDTGTGMSENILSHAFEPFFTTKRFGRGTGLGLSQVYGFIKQSGGFVRIESAPSEGTRVRVYLPRNDAPAGYADTRREATESCVAVPLGHRRRILIVEDQEEVRAQIVDALKEIGCEALEAADGVAGLRTAEERAPLDLLITDVGLPGLNGRQVAEGARAKQPDLPVLFITGYADKSLETLWMALNIEVLRKPFTLDDLIARVRALLKPEMRTEQ
ncbi:hybrid sensor histidine kinase/response regulator [Methylocystis bryophila]|uniref:histidine kinase n=1 Tax=Methylocystis bryophila TaxID=655015 RepID=A0A1W6N0E4_9HYPH|nr:hybrid sensor histidine kinase/response regulator [Methylocystis bryophila]